jgi:hypothetical protein
MGARCLEIPQTGLFSPFEDQISLMLILRWVLMAEACFGRVTVRTPIFTYVLHIKPCVLMARKIFIRRLLILTGYKASHTALSMQGLASRRTHKNENEDENGNQLRKK